MTFPLKDLTPATAAINSVFDHKQKSPYDKDGVVTAFTGDSGYTAPSGTCYQKKNGEDFDFGDRGHYRGTTGTGLGKRLCYDGHPGIDFYAEAGTPVLAAVSGKVSYLLSASGGASPAGYHTLTIIPDASSLGFKVYYLHLQTWRREDGVIIRTSGNKDAVCKECPAQDAHVNAGDVIGYSGSFGTGSAHLHFEVDTNGGIPIDPYGWSGPGSDPYTRANSTQNLWTGGGVPEPNEAPVPLISSPPPGSSFERGTTVTFAGSGTDKEDGTIPASSLSWSSSIDGDLGTGASVPRNDLSQGTHLITLVATDSKGRDGRATISVAITPPATNHKPVATISSPASGAVFDNGAAVTFAGSATDEEDGTLGSGSLVWTSDRDGQIGTGTSFPKSNLSAGGHTITLTATDSKGAQGTATITITVKAVVNNTAPTASISAPTAGKVLNQGTSITFTGSGSDAEDGSLSGNSLVWTSDRDGQIGTGTTFSRSDLSVNSHTITLTATDSKGSAATASVAITVQAVSDPNPVPVLSGLSPSEGDRGYPGFTLAVTGTGFKPSSVVRWNGSDRPTTYVGGGTLRATISSTDLSSSGSYPVTVGTPSPGGGTSASINFVVRDLGSVLRNGELYFDGGTVRLAFSGSGWGFPDADTYFACTHAPNFSLPRRDIGSSGLSPRTLPSVKAFADRAQWMAGTRPVAASGSNTAYVVVGCVKSGIEFESVAIALFGSDWQSKLVRVPQAVLDSFPTAPDVAWTPLRAAGTLIQGDENEVRWITYMGGSLGIPSQAALLSQCRALAEVVHVTQAEFNRYPTNGAILPSVTDGCASAALRLRLPAPPAKQRSHLPTRRNGRRP